VRGPPVPLQRKASRGQSWSGSHDAFGPSTAVDPRTNPLRNITKLAASTVVARRRKLEKAIDDILAAPTVCDLARDIQNKMRRARDQLLSPAEAGEREAKAGFRLGQRVQHAAARLGDLRADAVPAGDREVVCARDSDPPQCPSPARFCYFIRVSMRKDSIVHRGGRALRLALAPRV